MANSDKNIIITPFISGVTQPQMKFVGQGNDPIYLKVLDGITGTGATAGGALSVEGSAGQLFSIVNRLGTGSIFSVNDISGIPIIDANANGNISLAGYFGNVGVGLTAPTEKFQVTGNAFVSGLVTAVSGVSAAGGVTLAGTLQGTTAAFTGLVSSTVGFSGSGTNLKNIVTTFNGLSGAVTGVTVGGANTFTALNTFNAGISASALTVSGGVTFSGNVYLGDNATGVTAASNDFVRILAGTSPYGLWNGVAGIYQSRKNLSASTSGVICATPVVSIANYTTVELMVEYAEILSFSGGSPWACHKFVIVLTSDEEYGGVLSLSYTESITKNGSIATVPFTIDYDTGQNIEVTATVPANTSKFYVGWRFKTTVRVY
jgi:hypothetical protein